MSKNRTEGKKAKEKRKDNRNREAVARYIKDTYSVNGKYVCQMCGFSHEVKSVFEFHHSQPELKNDSISALVASGRSVGRVYSEMSKCIFICANCHRIIHSTIKVASNVRAGKDEEQLNLF